MSEKSWLATAAQWALWAVAMALIMGWLGRSRLRSRPTGHAHRLVHPPSTLIVGVACFGLFGGIAIVSNVYRNATTTWWTTATFVGFAALSLFLIADFLRAAHDVSSEGLSYRTFLGRRRLLRWSELRSVRYAPTMKWIRLETRAGAVARISVMLMGLPEFARQLLAHAPPDALDDWTRQVMDATAKGNPPSVWV